jgi:hypothetical protein
LDDIIISQADRRFEEASLPYVANIRTMDQETRRRRLIIFAAALAAIGATYAAVLVAQEEEMDKAIWCPRETAALVDYLHQRSFEVGNGGNFKNGTFNEAAGVIKSFLEAGADKAGMHCKTRWEKVSSPTALSPPLNHCCT